MLISTTKGIEPGNFKLMSQVLHEESSSSGIGVLRINLLKKLPPNTLQGQSLPAIMNKFAKLLKMSLGLILLGIYQR